MGTSARLRLVSFDRMDSNPNVISDNLQEIVGVATFGSRDPAAGGSEKAKFGEAGQPE